MAEQHPGTPARINNNNPSASTPDQGVKRNYSPGTTLSPNQEKKARKDSIDIDDIDPTQLEMEPETEKDLTMSDHKSWMKTISEQLKETVKLDNIKDLASKQDLDIMGDRITAQGNEIQQIRDEIKLCQSDISSLRSQFDKTIAEELERKLETAAGSQGQGRINMAAENQYTTPKRNTTRRNLVIQGLKGETEESMITNVIKVAITVGIIMYKDDIESILRLKNRDGTLGPVVTLLRISQRDKFLQKKINLRNVPGMESIFVNVDESIDVRRNKAILRKVAYNAKGMGASILFRHDRVTIDDIVYTLDDIYRIPEKYRPDFYKPERPTMSDNEQGATGGNIETTSMECTTSEQEKASKNPTISDEKRRLFKQDEKIRVTKSGIVFSGPSAFISNMYRSPVTYKNKDYVTNEHAIQCTKAEAHDQPALAEKLKKISGSFEVKKHANENIKSTDEWNAAAPNLIEELFEKKMEQNPELKL